MNNQDFELLPLNEIEKWIPEMRRLKVSEVARGPNGFINAYRAGIHNSDHWKKKRNSFIYRTLPQYTKKPK